jgi:nucleoid DNA-binding protein
MIANHKLNVKPQDIFDEIAAALARGDRTELRGFGTLVTKKNAMRDRVATHAPVTASKLWRSTSHASGAERRCASD